MHLKVCLLSVLTLSAASACSKDVENHREGKASADLNGAALSGSVASSQPPTKNCKPTGSSAAIAVVRIDYPQERQVVQRDGDNNGRIHVQGVVTGGRGIDAICVRTNLYDANQLGKPKVDFTLLANFKIDNAGNFTGTYVQAAGGWYSLELLPMAHGVMAMQGAYPKRVVQRVGVGEVFVTAGQSNASNSGSGSGSPGENLTYKPNDRVSQNYRGEASWKYGRAPLNGTFDLTPAGYPGQGGSPWPIMADILVQKLGVPVGITALALGGSSILDWQPEARNQITYEVPNTNAFYGLNNAVSRLIVYNNGFRAVLWHQGETDNTKKMASAVYFQKLMNLITASRLRLHQPANKYPWVIARAGWFPPEEGHGGAGDAGANDGLDAIISAQTKVVTSCQYCYFGPNTYLGDYRSSDLPGVGIMPSSGNWADGYHAYSQDNAPHLTYKGLLQHGKDWADTLLTNGILPR